MGSASVESVGLHVVGLLQQGRERGGIQRGVPSKFLYFPDENHWVMTPGNTLVWYQTVLAFLAEHVLGEEWQRPELL